MKTNLEAAAPVNSLGLLAVYQDNRVIKWNSPIGVQQVQIVAREVYTGSRGHQQGILVADTGMAFRRSGTGRTWVSCGIGQDRRSIQNAAKQIVSR